ncbi:serine protease [Cellulomonas composti]|uniref:Serine protease n=2 Tax=Cellulomonas composti TaxID=266130 RepID=A0A511J6Y7_9CELL|nr:serine protease [Cellulomonas composti]
MTGAVVAGAVVGGTAVLGGCAASPTAPPSATARADVTRVTVRLDDADALDDVVAATWALGVEALREGEDDDGTVVSPSSLLTALAMLGEGAGDGHAPFDAALGAVGDERTDAVNALLAALARYEGDPALVAADKLPVVPMLHTAQQIVVDDDATPQRAFLDRLAAGYGAGVVVDDLATRSDALDEFARTHTGGLVPTSPITPDPNLVAVLQDAVVLAAAWKTPFDVALSGDQPFTVVGERVLVPTMEGEFDTAAVSADGWQAVRLPYRDDLVADLYLPPEGSAAADDPSAAEPTTLAGLSTALDDAAADRVLVRLPTIDLESTTDLMTLLAGLGIVGADLTGVVEGSAVQAVQQAVLQVDEEGTRAAAVTSVGVTESLRMPPPNQVVLDRPFLMVVRDTTTGWPVFLAEVLDPRAG